MHIEIKKDDLLKKLEIVSRAATKHLTLPILQCVRIEASKNSITFSGTNLEISVSTKAEALVKTEGVVAVPASLLLQTVQLVPESKITLTREGESLVVASRGSHAKINAFPLTDYPATPALEGKGQNINGAVFAQAIRTAAFAASQSSIKPELGSIYINQKKERTLTFVATDSFRLMEKTVAQEKITLENPILIPQKNALEIARILELVGGDPTFIVGEGQAAFIFTDGTYIATRLTEGSFPDYVQIIPKEYATHVTVLASDLLHALKMTSVFANKFMQVSLEVHKAKKELVLSSDSGEAGRVTERIAASIDGEDLTLSFNQRYIIDPLSSFPSESITLHFAGVGRPLVYTGVGNETVRYLVMPMNK